MSRQGSGGFQGRTRTCSLPMLNGDLDESEPAFSTQSLERFTHSRYIPFAQRQVRRPRMRTQALRRAANDNRDRLTGALLQDIRARLLAHGAYTERKQDLAVYRHAEVGGEREEVRDDARELGGEAGRWGKVRLRQGEWKAYGRRTFGRECAHRSPAFGVSFRPSHEGLRYTYIPMIPAEC